MSPTDLQDRVDNPQETLEVELKRWLNLKDKLVRAKIARHICAIANHGGGYIVFGFNDDGSPDLSGPNYDHYSTDEFSGIAKAYLSPPPQCAARVVTSTAGQIHVVLWVPSHGSTPIMAIANGPHDERNRPQGIVAGWAYYRATGPESAPITTEAAWQSILHRCVINERETLLKHLTNVIRAPVSAEGLHKATDRLRMWHDISHADYVKALKEVGTTQEWPTNVAENHYQLSYALKPYGLKNVGSGFVDALGRVNSEVRDTVWSGWSMFYPFERAEIQAYFNIVEIDGEELEVVETNLLGKTFTTTTVPDFWRVSRDGLATIIRPYREDREPVQISAKVLRPGDWFYIYFLLRELAELLRHARALAKLFPDAETIAVRATWYGLKGRRIDNPSGGAEAENRVSQSGTRTIEGEWPVTDLAASWPEIVANMASYITRLFGGLEITPDWVQHEARKFNKLL